LTGVKEFMADSRIGAQSVSVARTVSLTVPSLVVLRPSVVDIDAGASTWRDAMPERSSITTVTFSHPFALTGVDGVQPAGTYTVETIDTTLDNISFIAYRRVSTSIMLPAVGTVARERQVINIDPLELEEALKRDAQT
jgi:hypothetical protein